MNKDIIEIAARTMKVSVEEAESHSRIIEEIDGYYFWNPIRGGISVIVNKNGEKLAVPSAVSFKKQLELFIEGKRN